MEHNAVKSPNHYTEGRRFEPKDVIRDWKLNFNLGSALKYIARAGRKGDIIEDLEKAREYLSFEVDAIKAERVRTNASHHVNYKCAFEGKELNNNDLGDLKVRAGVLEVPEGITLDNLIELILEKLFDDEEDE